MKHLFSAFPGGTAGIALLLFRCSLALHIAMQAIPQLANDVWRSLILGTLVLAVVIGIYMRVAAVFAVGAVMVFVDYPVALSSLPNLPYLFDGIALALIGPGAFSVDARRFGRSIINLPR